MTTVRAARLHKHGEPLKIEMVELPVPRDGEVLVDLAFAGVNPIDRYTAEGSVAAEGPLPRTLGFEAAGVLDGRSVVVHGEGLGTARDGVWAQAAVVPREAVTHVPEGVDLREAAAMTGCWCSGRRAESAARSCRSLTLRAPPSGGRPARPRRRG